MFINIIFITKNNVTFRYPVQKVNAHWNNSPSTRQWHYFLVFFRDIQITEIYWILSAKKNLKSLAKHSQQSLIYLQTFNCIFFVRVRCLMNCSFSGITCQRPNVTPPLKIATDTNKHTFDYNDTIEYRCPEGYNMNGKAVQHCTQNGILQQNLPTCLRMYFISTLKNRK